MLSMFVRSTTGGAPLGNVVPSAGVALAFLQQCSGPFPGITRLPLEPCDHTQAPRSPDSASGCSMLPSTSYHLDCRPRRLSSPGPTASAPHAQHPQHPHQLQQVRSYRIPYRVILPKTPYSERSGRPAPRSWPEFEVVKGGAANPEDLRWHRSVVRFPPEVSAELVNEEEEEAAGGGSSSSSSSSSGAGRTLVVSGRAGNIRLSLRSLDPTGLLALRLLTLPAAPGSAPSAPTGKGAAAAAGGGGGGGSGGGGQGRSLLVVVSPDKGRFEAVGAELNKAIRGVMTGYLLGLTVKGVGYRMEPLVEGENIRRPPALNAAQLLRRSRDPNGAGGAPKPYYFEPAGSAAQQQAQSSITFPFNKPAAAVRLKVGYSNAAVYPLPPHVRAFFLKPTLMYLYGIELDELRRVAGEIRSIRKPNPYTGNGIQYLDETVKLKQRAGAK